MSEGEFSYDQHALEMTSVKMAITFALGGVKERGERLAADDSVNDALRQMKDGLIGVASSLDAQGKAKLEPEIEPMMALLKQSIFGGLGAERLLLNLGLVLFCTQLEIFVKDLLDAVLRAEPRRFLDLYPEREVKAKEVVQANDYGTLMQRLRDKVIDEIDRQGTRQKFSETLGAKFGLLKEQELCFKFREQTHSYIKWNIDNLVEIFDQRHSVVHRGARPITDVQDLSRVQVYFGFVETVLTINAVRRYGVPITPLSVGMIRSYGRVVGISHKNLEEFNRKIEDRDAEPGS